MMQHWIKDMKYSTRVKDEEGYPAIVLVNKATGEALKHSLGQSHPVNLSARCYHLCFFIWLVLTVIYLLYNHKCLWKCTLCDHRSYMYNFETPANGTPKLRSQHSLCCRSGRLNLDFLQYSNSIRNEHQCLN